MFGLFKQSPSIETLVEKARMIARNVNSKVHSRLGKSDTYIEVEIFLYFYTVFDYWMMMNSQSNEKRTHLFNLIDQIIQGNSDWQDSRYNKEKLTKVMDDRIKNYFLILEKNNKRMEPDYFKRCVEYQVQLIAHIIEKRDYSFYNPVPSSPREYSAIITDFLLVSTLKSILVENMDTVVEYIKEIKNLK